MKNAIRKGRNRISPSRIFVEGISGTEDRVASRRSDTWDDGRMGETDEIRS